MMDLFQDIAIPIAWPDQTARGDEAWMAFFKKIGVVKNLNFKVGHAAIVLVERSTGEMKYYDFGRYLSPRGYGRARSASFDPRLRLDTKAKWNLDGSLSNLEKLLAELKDKEGATHGGGRLLCSLAQDISFKKAAEYAEKLVSTGVIKYGALAPENNSCSRYVAQILTVGMQLQDRRIKKILYPESLKASPTSNVVNASSNAKIICFEDGVIHEWKLNRWESLWFQIKLLKPNFFSKEALKLPKDVNLGYIQEPNRLSTLPDTAQWIGGMGEGCWFSIKNLDSHYEIQRFSIHGEIDYAVMANPNIAFDAEIPFSFTFDIQHHRHILEQNGRKIVFNTHQELQEIKMTI